MFFRILFCSGCCRAFGSFAVVGDQGFAVIQGELVAIHLYVVFRRGRDLSRGVVLYESDGRVLCIIRGNVVFCAGRCSSNSLFRFGRNICFGNPCFARRAVSFFLFFSRFVVCRDIGVFRRFGRSRRSCRTRLRDDQGTADHQVAHVVMGKGTPVGVIDGAHHLLDGYVLGRTRGVGNGKEGFVVAHRTVGTANRDAARFDVSRVIGITAIFASLAWRRGLFCPPGKDVIPAPAFAVWIGSTQRGRFPVLSKTLFFFCFASSKFFRFACFFCLGFGSFFFRCDTVVTDSFVFNGRYLPVVQVGRAEIEFGFCGLYGSNLFRFLCGLFTLFAFFAFGFCCRRRCLTFRHFCQSRGATQAWIERVLIEEGGVFAGDSAAIAIDGQQEVEEGFADARGAGDADNVAFTRRHQAEAQFLVDRQEFDTARAVRCRAGELYGSAFGGGSIQAVHADSGAHGLADAGIDLDRP